MIQKKFANLIPLYAVFDDSYLIISKILAQQIYELVDTCTPDAISSLYIKEMGAILKTPNSKFKLNYNYHGIHHQKMQEVKIDSTKHIIPNNHGWLSTNTELCLKFILQQLSTTHKDLVIVELGSWLGASTREILKTISSGVLYCFDHFQNVALTDYSFTHQHPLDKFWMTVPRYETFCCNVAPYISKNKKVFTIKYDVNKSINILKYNFITPHVVYIDAIKKTFLLLKYLQLLFKYSPKTIVVGDDYVFESVKNAVAKFMHNNHNYYLFTTLDCYILGQDTSFHTCEIKNLKDLTNKASSYIEKYIKADPMLEIIENLHTQQYDKTCQLLKQHKINVNIPLAQFNNNTFYTLVIIQIYSVSRQNAEIVRKYIISNIDTHPKKIKNSLFLTWQDYIDQKIEF